jgi:hypothetical protein
MRARLASNDFKVSTVFTSASTRFFENSRLWVAKSIAGTPYELLEQRAAVRNIDCNSYEFWPGLWATDVVVPMLLDQSGTTLLTNENHFTARRASSSGNMAGWGVLGQVVMIKNR